MQQELLPLCPTAMIADRWEWVGVPFHVQATYQKLFRTCMEEEANIFIGVSMQIEGQGTSESEDIQLFFLKKRGRGTPKTVPPDIQLVIAKAETGNPCIQKEVAARYTDRMHHVRWDHSGCAPSPL